MNSNARAMLEALRTYSINQNTVEAANAILNNEPVGPKGIPSQEMAESGFFGDFVQTVMTGDFLAAYGRADRNNQYALKRMLGPDLADMM